MRTFVALNLPPDERVRLHDALEPLRSKGLPIRWVPPESLHVTVKFLGDTESDGIDAIRRVLRAAAAKRSPFTLRIGGAGAFPSLRRANILWVGIAQEPEMSLLYRELEPALSRLGYPRENRPFRPHVTVGRLRSDARPIDVERLTGLVEYETEVRVETVDLMLSQPGPSGSRYEPLVRCALGEREEP